MNKHPQDTAIQKELICSYIDQRTGFVVSDAKTYIYVRFNDLLAENDIGGGNFATAYSQFALLNMLAKIHYFLDKPSKFISEKELVALKVMKSELVESLAHDKKAFVRRYLRLPRYMETNEEQAFVHLALKLEDYKIKLFEPRLDSAQEDLRTIWKGFRNTLSHLATVQQGKGVETFSFEEYWDWQKNSGSPLKISQIMERVERKSRTVYTFAFNQSTRGWMMNIDILTAILPKIAFITNQSVRLSSIDLARLKELSEFIQPS